METNDVHIVTDSVCYNQPEAVQTRSVEGMLWVQVVDLIECDCNTSKLEDGNRGSNSAIGRRSFSIYLQFKLDLNDILCIMID